MRLRSSIKYSAPRVNIYGKACPTHLATTAVHQRSTVKCNYLMCQFISPHVNLRSCAGLQETLVLFAEHCPATAIAEETTVFSLLICLRDTTMASQLTDQAADKSCSARLVPLIQDRFYIIVLRLHLLKS